MAVQPLFPTTGRNESVSWRRILAFYSPLVLTSLMLSLAGPVMNVAIGRAAEPMLEFAAFWIAFTIVLFVGSASLVVQQATVSLAGRASPGRLITAASLVGLSASTMVLVLAGTPLGEIVFRSWISTTPRTAALAREVLVILAPVPLLIALRGVGNGVAILEQRTSRVAAGTLLRIALLAGAATLAVAVQAAGARSAAWAFLLGTAVEAACVLAASQAAIRTRLRAWGDSRPEPGAMLRIGVPLVVSTFVWMSTRPIVNAILGRLPDPELAQASFGVVLPILLVTCSPLWALLEVSLVLPRSRDDLARISRLATGTAALFSVAILLLTWTPLRHAVLRVGFGLPLQLETAVTPALMLLVFEPFLLSVRAVSQGVLMRAGRTRALLVVSPIKILLMLAAGLFVAARFPQTNGALLATVLVLGGDLFDAMMYSIQARRVLDQGALFAPSVESRLAPGLPRRAVIEPLVAPLEEAA